MNLARIDKTELIGARQGSAVAFGCRHQEFTWPVQ